MCGFFRFMSYLTLLRNASFSYFVSLPCLNFVIRSAHRVYLASLGSEYLQGIKFRIGNSIQKQFLAPCQCLGLVSKDLRRGVE